MSKQPRRLTQRELEAIVEALNAWLAGEFAAELGKDCDGPSEEVYASALAKIQERRRARR